jgi:hypothetical protein
MCSIRHEWIRAYSLKAFGVFVRHATGSAAAEAIFAPQGRVPWPAQPPGE